MDAFPSDYVVHNLPLVILSGLEPELIKEQDAIDHSKGLLREGGFRIRIDAPPVTGVVAQTLLSAFLRSDASSAGWNGRAVSTKEHGGGYRIRSVGRTYTLPPRKAPPPPHSPRLSPTSEGPPAPLVLHSTISPLTPSSPLYPDGVITSVWITKHQTRLPAIFMTIFCLTSDPNQSSLQDNHLKSEIQNIRNFISSTSYKTKLVVVLVGDGAITSSALDERLSNIRKSCNLDAKILHYLPAAAAGPEIAEFVQNLLATLHPICVEYYRDLSKHARRKRSRGNIPPPTIAPTAGTSQVLPTQGWNSRYEFKLGVFAEFRQEMDAACRNYESAYESLFSPELFESTASWSPRFNEIRMLSDIIAIRIIRCQLWTEQSTGAVRSWRNHRDRIRSIIDLKGKGSENYGWEAWESIWSKTMAEMIARVDISSLSAIDPQTHYVTSIFASPEKALAIGERLAPWDLLHHAGYWLANTLKHIRKRRELAAQISEEDRIPPTAGLPASNLTNKNRPYDTYLALEPFQENPLSGDGGYDYRSDLSNVMKSAVEHFAVRGQIRMNERLQLEEALSLLNGGAWQDAAPVLRGLWKDTKWRTGGWWSFLSTVGWALYKCAAQSKDHELLIRLMWELSSCVFPPRPGFSYDLHNSMTDLEPSEARPAIVLSSHEVVSSVLPTFTFARAEGNVGQPLQAQLCLSSRTHAKASAIHFSEVKVVFEGGLRPTYLLHDESAAATAGAQQVLRVELEDSSILSSSSKKRSSAGSIASLTGRTNLRIGPNETKVYSFNIVPREAGEVKIASISMIVEDSRFNLTVVSSDLADMAGYWWKANHKNVTPRLFGMERDVTEMKILPKPPMVRVEAPEIKEVYYTNEAVQLHFNIVNGEEEAVALTLQARLTSPRAHAATLIWKDIDGAARPESEAEVGVLVLPSRDVGSIAPSASGSATMLMDNTLDALDHDLEIVARYHIASDPDTPLIKVSTFHLPFVRPFEANYNFGARYNNKPWPNFFKVLDPTDVPAAGLKQNYCVTASLYSFASGALEIESTNLIVHRVAGGAICTPSAGQRKLISPQDQPTTERDETVNTIVPDETQDYNFDLMVQKVKLGDRHAVGVDLTLEVSWRRPGSSSSVTSILEIPRFVAPMAEPRVLLLDPVRVSLGSSSADLVVYQIKFSLENPSMHFLTFNVTMESSEDFAFSGPKTTSVSLVPVSRHTIEYRLLLTKTAAWVGVNLGVVDAYFGKQLRVLPAGNGVRSDKKGNVSVWIP